MTKIFFQIVGVMVLICLIQSCLKEEFTTDTDDKLTFSSDTLTFDTVFTSLGSATRFITLRNTAEKYLRISNIRLENGDASFFRLNVDGIPGRSFMDIDIPPDDSIYLFAEVTIDPERPEEESPFVITENIIFETNGNTQSVTLEAWGQNAVYLPGRSSKGRISYTSCNLNEWVWDDPRPYVIYGALLIDSCTLRIPAGKKIHIHGGIGRNTDGSFYGDGILYLLRHASLRIEGTAEQPVVIEGDRLESSFDDVPGQWGRIWLGSRSKNHLIQHAEIRNGTIGLLVDSLAEVRLENTQIHTTASSALVGYSAKIDAINCLFHTSGGNNITLILGGNYNFTYCTMANYGTPTEALRASNFQCFDPPLCSKIVFNRLHLRVKNSIITGSSRDEISLLDIFSGEEPRDFDYQFENCLVKVDELLVEDKGGHPEFFDFCHDCIEVEHSDPLFLDIDNRNFQLDSASIAIGAAEHIPAISIDLLGNSRDADPDAGAFEYRQ